MYLLNAQQISKHVQGPRGHYLDIVNFDESKLQHTSYYFRLGEHCEILTGTTEHQIIRLTEEKPYLTLGPQGYAVVKSHETFLLSDKLIGVLGQTTKLAENGLELVHSPFIDPLYYGPLVFGLSNRLAKTVRIRLGDRIGKVSFFDISDTYPVSVIEGSILQTTFNERRPQRDDDPIPSWVENEEPDNE
jgi:deoxycytidine triphosphate deaminase